MSRHVAHLRSTFVQPPGVTMTAVELYFAATIAAGAIWIFVPGPVGTRALLVFRILARDMDGSGAGAERDDEDAAV
jgi:hypothetical protein